MTSLSKYGEIEDNRTCSKCGHDIDPAWVACPFCGKDLAFDKCTECGMSVQSDWSVCPTCGISLSHRKASGDPSPVVSIEEVFEWLVHCEDGPGFYDDQAMEYAEKLAGKITETAFKHVRLVYDWLVGEAGPEMYGEEAFEKALQLSSNGLTMNNFKQLKRKFEWAAVSEKGPQWDSEQALDWAVQKVLS